MVMWTHQKCVTRTRHLFLCMIMAVFMMNKGMPLLLICLAAIKNIFFQDTNERYNRRLLGNTKVTNIEHHKNAPI